MLSKKDYSQIPGLNTPDFVLMFMPSEPSFSFTLQNDPNIYNYAWDKKIVIVSPTTLLATLKTVASVWKQERQTKNALEIARQSGALYDKFIGFITDLEKIEKGLGENRGQSRLRLWIFYPSHWPSSSKHHKRICEFL